jgi:hypothetical protein
MKKTLFLPATLTFAMFVGCGGKSEPAANGPAAVGSIPSNAGVNGSPSQSQIVLPAEPKEIVRVFLDAMREGKGEQLAALFSTNARAEIQKHGIKIEPPGSAQATFVIGDAAPQGDAMLVSSLWKEPPATAGEVPQEMEVVWELRKEAAGWRVCGMAVDPGTGDEYEVVNFEKLDEPETGTPPTPQTRMASLPQGAPSGLNAPGMNAPAMNTQGMGGTSGLIAPGTNAMGGAQGMNAAQGMGGTSGMNAPAMNAPGMNTGAALPGAGYPGPATQNTGLPTGLPQGGFPQGGQPVGGLPTGGQPTGGQSSGLPLNGLPSGLPQSGR